MIDLFKKKDVNECSCIIMITVKKYKNIFTNCFNTR